MARQTKTVTTCDRCGHEFPESSLIVLGSGSRVGSNHVPQGGAMYCTSCLAHLSGHPLPVEERVVYVQSPDSNRGGGATGRPFVVGDHLSRSDLTLTDTWSTLQPQSTSKSSFSHGLGKSPSASVGRSTLLGRLLSCLTHET